MSKINRRAVLAASAAVALAPSSLRAQASASSYLPASKMRTPAVATVTAMRAASVAQPSVPTKAIRLTLSQ